LGEGGFEVPTAVTIKTKKSFPENGGSKFIRNIGNILLYYTASQSQKTAIFVFIAVRTSNYTALNMDHEGGGGGGHRKLSGKYFGLEAILYYATARK
jgi:hypothetical protein